MDTKARFVLIFALALLGGAAPVAVAWATPGNAPLAPGGAPTVVACQGEVRVGGDHYSGSGYFKFTVVNAAGDATYWSNDGSSVGGGELAAGRVQDGLDTIGVRAGKIQYHSSGYQLVAG